MPYGNPRGSGRRQYMANVLIVTNIGKFRQPPPSLLTEFHAVIGVNRCETIETGLTSVFFGCWPAAHADDYFWRVRIDRLKSTPFWAIPNTKTFRTFCAGIGRADLNKVIDAEDYPKELLEYTYGWTTAGRAALWHVNAGDSVTVWGTARADRRASWAPYQTHLESRILWLAGVKFIGQEEIC